MLAFKPKLRQPCSSIHQQQQNNEDLPPVRLCLVVDCSNSMAEDKGIEGAKQTLHDIVSLLPDHSVVSLASFGSTVRFSSLTGVYGRMLLSNKRKEQKTTTERSKREEQTDSFMTRAQLRREINLLKAEMGATELQHSLSQLLGIQLATTTFRGGSVKERPALRNTVLVSDGQIRDPSHVAQTVKSLCDAYSRLFTVCACLCLSFSFILPLRLSVCFRPSFYPLERVRCF